MSIQYKIRDTNTGKFSDGGMSPRFTTNGKLWRKKAHLNYHLKIVMNRNIYTNCEIVEYELIEQQSYKFDMPEAMYG